MATSTSRHASELAFGITLLLLAALVLVAVSNPLEIAVWLGGPLIALLGFIMAIRAIATRRGPQAIWFGPMAFVLGTLLGSHDFLFPPGIAVLVHLSIGITLLALAILQLVAKRTYASAWLKGRHPA